MTPREIEQRSDQLARDYQRLHKELAPFLTDPAVMALPHPLRTQTDPGLTPTHLAAGVVGVEEEAFTIAQLRAGVCSNAIWRQLEQRGCEQFLAFVRKSSEPGKGSFNAGVIGPLFHAMRHMHCGGVMFTIDDELVPLLMATDIDLDVPIADVRLPFENVYIEFGRDRARSPEELLMFNPLSGDHFFEGAYVSRTHDTDGTPYLEITMTGSPTGHANVGDDAVEWVALRQDEKIGVHEALRTAFISGYPSMGATEADMEAFRRVGAKQSEVMTPYMAARLEMIVKALLYIDLKEARRATVGERTDARKALMRAQSGSHRRKAIRQMLRSRDTVLILAPAPQPSEAATHVDGHDQATRAPHWRRGHFRRQRYGPEHANVKTIWLRPTLINAAHLGAEGPAPRKYVVQAPGAGQAPRH